MPPWLSAQALELLAVEPHAVDVLLDDPVFLAVEVQPAIRLVNPEHCVARSCSVNLPLATRDLVQ